MRVLNKGGSKWPIRAGRLAPEIWFAAIRWQLDLTTASAPTLDARNDAPCMDAVVESGLSSDKVTSMEALTRTIRIAAALIDDDTGQLLLVRKAGTRWFMQAGGKIEDGESPYSR